MKTIKQIHVSQLRAGMYLHKLGDDWMNHPFWRRSFVLKSADLKKIAEAGIDFAWIDIDKGLDEALPEVRQGLEEPEVDYMFMPTLPPPTEPMPIETAEMEEIDLHRVNQLCTNASSAIDRLLKDARLGRALDLAECREVVEEIVDHVMGNAAALIMVVRLKSHDEDSYMHSVTVCALMISLAKQLSFNRRQMCEAGLSGLVHDVGKALVPMELLNKPGKLTADEYRLVKTHSQRGHALLAQSARPCAMAMEVCLHHHERMDGSGYPHGLTGDAISLFAKMAGICDVYDALTSNRAHRARLDPTSALRVMNARTGQFDPKLFQSFVKTIGIYPIGTVVKLHSQMLAVVVGHDADNLLQPRVKVFYSLRAQESVDPYNLALASERCTDEIVDIEPSNEMHVLAMEMI
jgi:HD-GYP domain-containing protein (c-di-GMP phosphodiesterase class II)